MRGHWLGCVVVGALLACAGAASAQTVHCVSDGTKKTCEADTHAGVRLVKQRSDAACKQGESWGYDEHGIWVDHGCDADFALGLEGAAGTAGGGKVLTCSSDGGKKYCDASTGRGVQLVKQLSEAACKKDDSWGYDGLGIWVDKGCSAQFALGVTPKPAGGAASDAGNAKDKTCLAQVGKARAEQMVKECLKVSAATHPPCNVQNSCELIEEEIRSSCAILGRDAPAFCGGYK